MRLWVIRTGWHTGLVLPSRALGTRLRRLLALPRGTRRVVFGWGDLRWYAENHTGILAALRALLPSRSVLWVEPCPGRLSHCLPEGTRRRALVVGRPGLDGLDRFLRRTLALDARGKPRPVARTRRPAGEFLLARPPYDAFHTCNTWTAEALEAARLPVSSFGVLFAVQLWNELPRCPGTPPGRPRPLSSASGRQRQPGRPKQRPV